MKNIHVIPTDKPNFGNYLVLNKEGKLCIWNTGTMGSQKSLSAQHIYITSDEEIKEGDKWIYNIGWNEPQKIGEDWVLKILNESSNTFKIILTTDQDLDGVQPIDDEFLEWFVKNPSCEFVEWSSEKIEGSFDGEDWKFKYGTVIPKEEPKQTVQEYEQQVLEKYSYELEPKQEKLEEVAEKEAEGRYPVLTHSNPKNSPYVGVKQTFKHGVRFGAKWQQEQDKNKYSEEEVRRIAEWSFHFHKTNDFSDSELADEWELRLEKMFKKK